MQKALQIVTKPKYALRYGCGSYAEICRSVSPNVTPPHLKKQVFEAMLERRFCPSGNTLAAARLSNQPIRPNCCVLPTVTDENFNEIIRRAKPLWRHSTGIGFDLTGCRDPVGTLHRLMDENRSVDFEHGRRRGGIAILAANHPKAIEFALAKAANADKLFAFNISLSFEDDFQFEVLLNEAERNKTGVLWNAAVAVWQSGDPGLLFLHRFRNSLRAREACDLLQMAPLTATGPCGEQAMHEDECCTSGAINLASDYLYDEKGEISISALRQTVRTAVRFLDAIVDRQEVDDYAMMRKMTQFRRIGLGVTGFADALIRATMSYDSLEARQFGGRIAKILTEEADLASRKLAQQFGSFANGSSRRNVTITCSQPTGNLTPMLGAFGYSIEPLMAEAVRIHWRDHLAMLNAWQEHLENGISKTVNLPEETTVQGILDVFRGALLNRFVRGIALYRDGSRNQQPITLLKPNNIIPKLKNK